MSYPEDGECNVCEGEGLASQEPQTSDTSASSDEGDDNCDCDGIELNSELGTVVDCAQARLGETDQNDSCDAVGATVGEGEEAGVLVRSTNDVGGSDCDDTFSTGQEEYVSLEESPRDQGDSDCDDTSSSSPLTEEETAPAAAEQSPRPIADDDRDDNCAGH